VPRCAAGGRTEDEPERPRAVAREECGQRRARAGPAERARELDECEREEEDLEEQRGRASGLCVSASRGQGGDAAERDAREQDDRRRDREHDADGIESNARECDRERHAHAHNLGHEARAEDDEDPACARVHRVHAQHEYYVYCHGSQQGRDALPDLPEETSMWGKVEGGRELSTDEKDRSAALPRSVGKAREGYL
jgi:hypothetical protein